MFHQRGSSLHIGAQLRLRKKEDSRIVSRTIHPQPGEGSIALRAEQWESCHKVMQMGGGFRDGHGNGRLDLGGKPVGTAPLFKKIC